MPRVSSLWCLLVLFGPLSVGCGRTSQPSWVSECRRYLDDNPVVDMRDHCMSGFFDHYTATTEHTVGHPPDAACLAQAWIYRHQFCGDCGANSTIGIPGSGYMVPTGLGSRWHLMGREIPRAIAENRTMRLWDPRKSGAFGCIYLRSSECPEASERCYFQTVDGCPQVDIWNVPDKPRRMASWRQGKVLRRAQLPDLLQTMSSLWLSSQFLFFVLQPRPQLHEWVRDFWSAGNPGRVDLPATAAVPPERYIAMHVRWGDKCFRIKKDAEGQIKRVGGREAKCVPFSRYMAAAQLIRRDYGVSTILLSTESPEAVRTVLAGQYPGWTFHFSNTTRTTLSLPLALRRGQFGDGQEARNSITNFMLAIQADHLICTPSSNWCRAIFRYVMALRGSTMPYIFMDRWSHDTFNVFPDDEPVESMEHLARLESQELSSLPFPQEKPPSRARTDLGLGPVFLFCGGEVACVRSGDMTSTACGELTSLAGDCPAPCVPSAGDAGPGAESLPPPARLSKARLLVLLAAVLTAVALTRADAWGLFPRAGPRTASGAPAGPRSSAFALLSPWAPGKLPDAAADVPLQYKVDQILSFCGHQVQQAVQGFMPGPTASVDDPEVAALSGQLSDILLTSGASPGQSLWGVRLAPGHVDPLQAALLRAFLTPVGNDVGLARRWLEDTLRWRRQTAVEQLRPWQFSAIYPKELLATRLSRDGLPQIVLRVRHIPPEIFEDEHELDGIMTHVLASRPKRYIFVVDMQGFSQYHIGGQARKCARRLSAVISEYYPNLIDRTEVVNAPLLFAGIWAFVRPFMPKDFAESLCLVRTGDVDLGEIREIGGQADMAWRL